MPTDGYVWHHFRAAPGSGPDLAYALNAPSLRKAVRVVIQHASWNPAAKPL